MSRPTEELYEKLIVAHYESSRHRGVLEAPTLRHSERNPACGDAVRLDLLLHRERVQQLRFQAEGCIISQAAASILCEYAEGKTIADLQEFLADEMLKLLQVPLVPGRIQCALLPFRTLKAIVYCSQRRAAI